MDRDPIEGGIGGTGIVGVVTNFGSLIVNGLKIETNGATRYSNATGRLTERSIGLGDGLTVEAETRGGRLLARRVHVTHPLIGRIQAAAGDGALLRINGVNVMVEEQARNRARPGDRVKVSGLWMDNIVVASQIIRTRTDVDVIAGDADMIDGTLSVAGVPISRNLFGSRAKQGQFVTVLGTFEGQQMAPKHVRLERFTGAAGALGQLSVEGYLAQKRTKPEMKLSGLGHSFARDQKLGPFGADSRSLFEGGYTDAFAVERGLSLPGDYGQRRALFLARAMGVQTPDWTDIS